MDQNIEFIPAAVTPAGYPTFLSETLCIGPEVDWQPDHLLFSAWTEHLPFAFWIVKALHPRRIVELGTHWGVSYGGFCQAVDRLGLSCFCHAVDSWTGDAHAGEYGEDVFAAVERVNSERWARFSTLHRTTFAEARTRFLPGEVDLLHIDGFHTYEAVAEDFATWRDTLSDRGVVLFHDTNVRRDDFGVWKLWRELAAVHPHFEFTHGHGLGVLGLGSEVPAPVRALFDSAGEPAAVDAIRNLFAARGAAAQLRWDLMEARRALRVAEASFASRFAEADAAFAQRLSKAEEESAERLRAAEADAGRLRAAEASANWRLTEVQTRLAAVALSLRQAAGEGAARTVALTGEAAELKEQLRAAHLAAQRLRERGDLLEAQRDAMVRSNSWAITRPLRTAVGLLRGQPAYWARLREVLRRRDRSADHSAAPPLNPPLAIMPEIPRLGPEPARRTEPVDIIVCVHNAPADARRCLSSVLARTLPPYRLILVDDGSAAETRDMLAEFARSHGATLIRNEVALGYTRAANLGLGAGESPWAVLLNSDTVVTTSWLDRLWEQAARDPRVGIAGPLSNTASWQSVPIMAEDGDWAENPLPEGVGIEDMARVVAAAAAREGLPLPFLNGFCLLLRRRMLDEIGRFDEEQFGAGYGEENDLCIRARKAGWRLVVAEDAYVFHAQSRSYSHERRKALCAEADAKLASKHDPALHILPQVGFCRDGLAIAGQRARIAAGLEREALRQKARALWEGRRVAFVLPVAHAGGGAKVVLQEALAMRGMGVDAAIVNLAAHRESFEASYPGLGLPLLYAADAAEVPRLLSDRTFAFDAVIATAYYSAYWLPSAQDGRGGPIPAYYVQDFEPLFFDDHADPERQVALASYSFRPDLRMVTKTDWNAGLVEAECGRRPEVVGPSVDLDLFRPAPDARADSAEPLHVVAMVRPSTPRRRPAATAELLTRLHARYGGRVRLTAFGADADELSRHGIRQQGFAVAGRLRSEEVASLLRRSDVFVDLSEFQAMGLTALEAMASGCAVVVPKRGGAVEFIAGGEAGLAVDTNDPKACEAAAVRLIEDAGLRARLRLRATSEAPRHSPEVAAFRMLSAILPNQAAHASLASAA